MRHAAEPPQCAAKPAQGACCIPETFVRSLVEEERESDMRAVVQGSPVFDERRCHRPGKKCGALPRRRYSNTRGSLLGKVFGMLEKQLPVPSEMGRMRSKRAGLAIAARRQEMTRERSWGMVR